MAFGSHERDRARTTSITPRPRPPATPGPGVRIPHATPRRGGSDPAAGWSHRDDIEGLRAVAVVLVLLFHAAIGPFNGGFVGVDVFFVLSGFLITGLLLREVAQTGTISLSGFYARRVRRLLPAALLVLLVTLAASFLWLPPLLVPGVAADVAAAAAYVSNMWFAVQATDYFNAGNAPSPVLHFWSLGVEEQFYLFWPAILLVVARATRGRGPRIAATVIGISLASFLLSLWWTDANPPWAFFALPTRAWELGLGAILAVAGWRLTRIPARPAAVAAWAGLAMIVAAALLFDQNTPFPGTAALLPTVGAALVVAGGASHPELGPGRFLGAAVPTFLGRISYSLYLWHWPLLVIPAIVLGAELPLPARIFLVLLAIGLAAVTQRIVEDPLRRGLLVSTRPRRNLALAGAFTLTVAIIAVSVGATAAAGLRHSTAPVDAATNEQAVNNLLGSFAPDPSGGTTAAAPTAAPTAAGTAPAAVAGLRKAPAASRPPAATPTRPAPDPTAFTVTATPSPTASPAAPTPTPAPTLPAINRGATPDGAVPANLQPAIADAKNDYPQAYLDGCHTQMDGHQNSGSCLYGNVSSPTTIALFGDSHALAWFPALERFAQQQGWRLLSLTMSACSPATIPMWIPDWKRVSWECNDWRESAIQQLIAARPSIIIVTGTRGFETTDSNGSAVITGTAHDQAWQAGMLRTLARLAPVAKRVLYVADTPIARLDPPTCLSQHQDSVLACATPVDLALNASWLALEKATADRADVGFIDPERWVCPTSPCPVTLGNFLIYRDAGHLTATFSEALAGQMGNAILADLRRAGISLS